MNKKLLIAVLVLVTLAGMAVAQTPTAADLLARVDANEIFDTIYYEAEMIIERTLRGRLRRDVKNMNVWARGNTHNFMEFTNRDDRGVRYLMNPEEFVYYHPDNERPIDVPSHMLVNWMESDLSFEDVQENATLSSRYRPVITGTDTVNGRPAWVLELTAIGIEKHPFRRLWIDQGNYDLVKYELLTLSRTAVQEYNLVRIDEIGGRRFPVEIEVRDLTRNDSRTVMILRNVQLNIPIADSVFDVRNLRR